MMILICGSGYVCVFCKYKYCDFDLRIRICLCFLWRDVILLFLYSIQRSFSIRSSFFFFLNWLQLISCLIWKRRFLCGLCCVRTPNRGPADWWQKKSISRLKFWLFIDRYRLSNHGLGLKDSSHDLQSNCIISFCFYLYLIFNACVTRFDVNRTLKKFLVFRMN